MMESVEFLKIPESKGPTTYRDAMMKMLAGVNERLARDGWGQPIRLFMVEISHLAGMAAVSMKTLPMELVRTEGDLYELARNLFVVELGRYVEVRLDIYAPEPSDEPETLLDMLVTKDYVSMVVSMEHELGGLLTRSLFFNDLQNMSLALHRTKDGTTGEQVITQQGGEIQGRQITALKYINMAVIMARLFGVGSSPKLFEDWILDNDDT